MPLRDHFHPPLSKQTSWDGLHGAWPTMIVVALNNRLPAQYVASPRIHLGTSFEVDVATFTRRDEGKIVTEQESAGGTATALWAPPLPTLVLATDFPDLDEYEVQVFETESQRLVAAVEIVSPANKDRPEHRRAFVAKCATLVQQGISVSIIDLVTSRLANLYSDMLDLLGKTDPSLTATSPPLYAATCRWRHAGVGGEFATWSYPLEVGQVLPTLPLWLDDELAVPLELESTYEETCRALRIR